MIFIILPAYNEEKNIGRVIRGLLNTQIARIDGEDYADIEIVVVDDGSSDRTGEIAQQEGAVVLRHEINRGQGAALQTGNEYAFHKGAEVVVHFDADNQFNPADIVGAVRALKSQALDVILGSRFLDSRSRIPWFKRYVVFPVSRWINYVFTGLRLSDVHNGFRVLSRNALQKLHITHDGMAHNSEIIAQLKKHNLKFTEYPVKVVYHEYGQGVLGGLKIIWDLLVSKF